MNKKLPTIGVTLLLVILVFVAISPEPVNAGSYDGHDLAVCHCLRINQHSLVLNIGIEILEDIDKQ